MGAWAGDWRWRVLELFARLVEYPGPGLDDLARECEALVAEAVPDAARFLGVFRGFLRQASLSRVREAYTAFFDLNPVCAPYLGYQLFGETYRRSVLMLALVDRYQEQGFEFNRSELPDRISVVMRYAAAARDEALVVEGLIPALRRMTGVEQGPPADGRGAMGAGNPQLEGHSHGGHLDEGVLLEMTEGRSGSGRRAYESLLTAIRVALEALWPVPATVPARRPLDPNLGGRNPPNGRSEQP